MIPIPLPVVLVLGGAIFWPVTLAIAVVFAWLGFFLSLRWARVVCLVVAVLLGADCLLALRLAAV